MSRLTAWIRRQKQQRGVDQRSFFRRLSGRLEGESGIVHAFGESHSQSMVGTPGVVVHSHPGMSMYRVGVEGVPFLRKTTWRLGRKSALLFAFGGIDVRVHVARVAKATDRSIQSVMDELVARYFDAVERKRGGRRVVIGAVLPPATDRMAARTDNKSQGTEEDRVAWTRLMNETLQRAAAERGYLFCNAYGAYADERGCLREDLSDGSLHLGKDMGGPLRAALEAELSVLREARMDGGGARPQPATPSRRCR